MNKRRKHLQVLGLAFAAGLSFVAPCFGQEEESGGFIARVFTSSSGETMPYRLFIPRDYDAKKTYPLVLWLHGSPARGTDNAEQISGTQMKGTHVWVKPEYQTKYRAFVLVPQCPEHRSWVAPPGSRQLTEEMRLVLAIMRDLQREFSLDSHRFYVAGQSMGAIGAWQLISQYPTMFAAAVILCGKGDPSHASSLAKLPIWVFHGANDTNPSTPVANAREMVAAIDRAGGRTTYTEYSSAVMEAVRVPNVPLGHNVWDKAFDEPALIPWVFAQARSRGNRDVFLWAWP
jgi:predicted peptidase